MSVIETSATAQEDIIKRHSGLVDLLIRMKRKPLGATGAILVLVLLFAGIFADLQWMGLPQIGLAPYHYNDVHLRDRLLPPSAQYVLGTDNLGRDLLSRVIYGARVSLIVGLSATALSTIISTILGTISGYLGGKVDLIMQRFIDAWLCFPGLIIYLTLMSLIGAGMLQVILVLGISGGIGGSRGARSYVFWIKESTYVGASQAIGCSAWQIIWHHLIPNIMPMLIVGFSMGIGGIILAEAGLSFLGFGIPPPIPSWGGMLSGAGRTYMFDAPWLALWPGVALTLTIYGVNMFGDALRDLLDPRLRGGMGGIGGYGTKRARKALENLAKKKAKAARTVKA
ncbi:MAG TPA: ABC transporter permease [Dehalococcoidia bacterium]|nr:ABC transporter permease [Dehalococcoidia bacterium]